MKHLQTVSRTPILADSEGTELDSLIGILGFVLAIFNAFSTSATSLFTGVTTALTSKSNTKSGT
ncbi:MAG: hypothetical protein GY851_06055 [bacterium]|nr:hypothetical protein [bacterium]